MPCPLPRRAYEAGEPRTTPSSCSHPRASTPSALRYPCRAPQRPAMALVHHSHPSSLPARSRSRPLCLLCRAVHHHSCAHPSSVTLVGEHSAHPPRPLLRWSRRFSTRPHHGRHHHLLTRCRGLAPYRITGVPLFPAPSPLRSRSSCCLGHRRSPCLLLHRNCHGRARHCSGSRRHLGLLLSHRDLLLPPHAMATTVVFPISQHRRSRLADATARAGRLPGPGSILPWLARGHAGPCVAR